MDKAKLHDLIGLLADPQWRTETIKDLCLFMGVSSITCFVKDPELEIMLPALGFQQTYCHKKDWDALISASHEGGMSKGDIRLADGATMKCTVLSYNGICAIVFGGGCPLPKHLESLKALLPLLGSIFHYELSSIQQGAQLKLAEQSVHESRDISQSLQLARKELQLALTEKELEIQERKYIEKELNQSEERFRLLVDGIRDYAIFTLSLSGLVTTWNSAAERILGYGAQEIVGLPLAAIYSDSDRLNKEPDRDIETTGKKGRSHAKRWYVRKDGSCFWGNCTITPLDNEGMAGGGYAVILRDETELKESEDKIQYQAYHDALTGLPNRLLLEGRLSRALASVQDDDFGLAVLFIDLDRFKNINDTLGHQIGDKILQEVATRLYSSVTSEDTVSRLGGDEFVVVLNSVKSREVIIGVIKKIQAVMRPTINVNGHDLHVGASIGIAEYPLAGSTVEKLIQSADTALYKVKESGRNSYAFYTSYMHAQVTDRLSLENELQHALKNSEFEIYYQPIVSISSGSILGVEALMRWNRPGKDLQHPDVFIPIAEEIGMVNDLAEWSLREACTHVAQWLKQGMPALYVSVNISALQFATSKFIPTVAKVLLETGCPAKSVQLEITESFAVTNIELTIQKLRELNSMGIKIAIDDFGTGHSSLSYLKSFEIDCLKIDRSFVSDCITNNHDAVIASTIITMAHSLGLEVIAEGVENFDQATFLREKGCDIMQGYLFSRAINKKSFEKMMWERTTLPLVGIR